MTADLVVNVDNASVSTKTAPAEQRIPSEVVDIFDFLSANRNIIFKSQQIDDPDIPRSEKVKIAEEIFQRNKQTFLLRFGGYLEEEHLNAFSRHCLSEDSDCPEREVYCEELCLLLRDLRRRIHSRKQDVKNRRYTALLQLQEKGEYFSEQEMMNRSPELYQELVGQYLSDAERKQRDSYDVKNTTISDILIHTFEKERINDVLKRVQSELTNESCEKTEPNADEPSSRDNEGDDIPLSYRSQWGNFDNERIACSTSRTRPRVHVAADADTSSGEMHTVPPARSTSLITAGERDLLRQEFIGLMHERFLSGMDKDFDYTHVDDNPLLDNLQQLDQDEEDAYFEESDNDSEQRECKDLEDEPIKDVSDESEDELDIFMSHLSRHHSLRN